MSLASLPNVAEIEDAVVAEAGDPSWSDILTAWETAVARLQATQNALKTEVKRLREELGENRRELERKRRLADLGQMACHIAHEVRNGLVPTTLYAGMLERRLAGDPESLTLLAKLTAGMKQVDGTVRELLAWSRELETRARATSVRAWLSETLEPLTSHFAAHGIAIDLSAVDDVVATFDPDLLRRAATNLALNAVDALPRGGAVAWSARIVDGALELAILDDGPGVPPEERERLFQPFFTTRAHGTGLGLALVRKIAEAHGGEASYRDAPTGGACFVLLVPRDSESAS